jgi:SAM-dependent methyltransferase
MSSQDPASGDRERTDRAHFDRIATEYAAKDDHPACRVARRWRVQATLGFVPVTVEPRVLEVGCGAGFACEYLRGKLGAYTGLDYSPRLIDYARKRHRTPNAAFETGNGRDFFDDDPYDVIFMIGVLHHVEDKDSLVSNLLRSLRPGGWLVVNEPQPHNPAIRLARSIRSRFDRSYSSEQEQISQQELAALLERHGLEDIRLQAQGFLSTPFAEVPLRPRWLTTLLARSAVSVDRWAERRGWRILHGLAWNCIAAGRAPDQDSPSDVRNGSDERLD